MVRSLEAERARGVALFGAAETLDDLEAAQVEVMGRRSRFSAVQKAVGSVPPEDRKRVGQVANDVRGELQQALAARREALESLAEAAEVNLHE